MEDSKNLYALLASGFKDFFKDVWSVVCRIFYNLTHSSDGSIHISFTFIVLILIFCGIITFFVLNLIRHSNFKKQNKIILNEFAKIEEEIKNLPGKDEDLTQKVQLNFLLDKCIYLGVKIDRHTNRPNNSKHVSDLVYKMCLLMNKDYVTTAIYFCASLVYDIGFLSLPKNLFYVDILSSADKELLKEHVNIEEDKFDFVPSAYIKIFLAAAREHHEKINASGYPKGLDGKNISEIARLITIAETYVSLTSVRHYHRLYTKKAAFKILKSNPTLYDENLVDIFKSLILTSKNTF